MSFSSTVCFSGSPPEDLSVSRLSRKVWATPKKFSPPDLLCESGLANSSSFGFRQNSPDLCCSSVYSSRSGFLTQDFRQVQVSPPLKAILVRLLSMCPIIGLVIWSQSASLFGLLVWILQVYLSEPVSTSIFLHQVFSGDLLFFSCAEPQSYYLFSLYAGKESALMFFIAMGNFWLCPLVLQLKHIQDIRYNVERLWEFVEIEDHEQFP